MMIPIPVQTQTFSISNQIHSVQSWKKFIWTIPFICLLFTYLGFQNFVTFINNSIDYGCSTNWQIPYKDETCMTLNNLRGLVSSEFPTSIHSFLPSLNINDNQMHYNNEKILINHNLRDKYHYDLNSQEDFNFKPNYNHQSEDINSKPSSYNHHYENYYHNGQGYHYSPYFIPPPPFYYPPNSFYPGLPYNPYPYQTYYYTLSPGYPGLSLFNLGRGELISNLSIFKKKDHINIKNMDFKIHKMIYEIDEKQSEVIDLYPNEEMEIIIPDSSPEESTQKIYSLDDQSRIFLFFNITSN